MVEASILAHPDFLQSFILESDASECSISAVLSQKIEEQEHAIEYTISDCKLCGVF